MNLPEEYSIRPATAEDAEIIAIQRGQMFVDMGSLTPETAAWEYDLWAQWLRQAIPSGEYAGFVAEHAGEVIGGVGMLFQTKFPTHKDPGTLKALILNMSVSPEHRRKGLAEALMQAALAELRVRGLRNVSLNAAPMGKRIYERLGFKEADNPEMRLTLEAP